MSGVVRYPNYKKTGTHWLPEIPVSWEIVPFKSLYGFGKGLPITKENLQETGIPVISYGQIHSKSNTGTTLKEELLRYVSSDYLSGFENCLLKYGDMAIADTSEDEEGCGNSVLMDRVERVFAGYHTIIARIKEVEYARYLALVFQSGDWRSQLRNLVHGVKVFSVTKRILSTTRFPLPPLPEQRAIVAYLDDKCGKIDKLVAAKEKEVELLKELKQTVIADAVTKGIDGSSPNKETGVFWQPLMPEGWSVRKLRHILKKLDRPRPDGAELLVCTNKGTVNKRGDAKIGLVSEDVSIYQGVASGDLLIHGMDTWHGAIAVSKLNGMCTTVVHVCDSTENKLFVAHYLRNMARGRLFKLLSNGVRQNTSDFRSWEKLAPLQIVLPPREEQNRIVAYIEEKTAKIDQAVAGLAQQVAALKEYKQRLIADVVTGQMRVA